ncbi:hypothetical protein [Granulicella paludicola]|uniref:hypothetical protein n=1 Tax=Granulicella paludicola TaxID=474951 RepID=UPI0021DFBA3A|nr:hypothetical protein [Granulicella paludicola]
MDREHGREIRAFWTGVGGLVLALCASAYLKEKDPTTLLVLRVIAGVSVGLCIAFIPGFFSLETSVERPGVKIAFRATGALAAVVMIYFFDPGWVSSLAR